MIGAQRIKPQFFGGGIAAGGEHRRLQVVMLTPERIARLFGRAAPLTQRVLIEERSRLIGECRERSLRLGERVLQEGDAVRAVCAGRDDGKLGGKTAQLGRDIVGLGPTFARLRERDDAERGKFALESGARLGDGLRILGRRGGGDVDRCDVGDLDAQRLECREFARANERLAGAADLSGPRGSEPDRDMGGFRHAAGLRGVEFLCRPFEPARRVRCDHQRREGFLLVCDPVAQLARLIETHP